MSRTRSTTLACAAAALIAVGTLAACGTAREFIWVDAVPRTMLAGEARSEIAVGDVVSVRVFNQDANSADRVRVREDGKIALPLLHDVQVAGFEPAELARRLEVKLKEFITTPVVTVVVNERRPLHIPVMGRVARPGIYDLERGSSLVHALASAGGLTPFADESRIFVLRSGYWADGNPAPARIRFRYRDLATGKVPAALFSLRPGDVVVAE
jgi:polysaccharide export outer membrane protein